MFVLQIFNDNERPTIDKVIKKTVKEIKKSLEEGIKEVSL